MQYEVFYYTQIGRPADEPAQVSREYYKPVGQVEANNLEHLFRVMNVVDGSDFEIPQKLRVRSMCVGDVAVDEKGKTFYCAPAGWTETQLV